MSVLKLNDSRRQRTGHTESPGTITDLKFDSRLKYMYKFLEISINLQIFTHFLDIHVISVTFVETYLGHIVHVTEL